MHITLELKALFDDMILEIGKENLKEFIKCNPNDLADYHYTIGLWFRNRIMTKPVITNFFDELNIKNKDDISYFLLLLFWHYLH